VARFEDGTRQRPSAAAVILGWCLLAAGLVPAAMVGALLLGVGLHREVPGAVAACVAFFGLVLPVLGLGTLLGRSVLAFGVSLWLYAAFLLVLVPLYLPGERSRAVHEGLLSLAAPLGERGAGRLASATDVLLDALGGDPEIAPPAIRLSDEASTGSRSEDLAPPLGEDSGSVDARESPRPDLSQTESTVVPYEGDGHSLVVDVHVDGPVFGESLAMIFDTGATFTTLDYAALRALGISLPSDAPVATLQTANGIVEAPLVLVDAVWLGDQAVEWVTIAVCDPCARPGVSGLLGLNVTGQFQVALDHETHEIRLVRRRTQRDRQLDIAQWLQLRSTVRRWWDGRVEVEITGENRSQAPIQEAVIEVECLDGRYAVQLLGVPPEGRRSTTAALPRGSDCSEYSIRLHSGSWPRARG